MGLDYQLIGKPSRIPILLFHPCGCDTIMSTYHYFVGGDLYVDMSQL